MQSKIFTMNKKLLLLLCLFSLLMEGLAAQEAQLVNYASSILRRDLQEHVAILASDSLQGRATGTPGGKMAGDYIARCFEEYGLQAPFNGSYFQIIDSSTQARNVIGIISGTEDADKAIILGAHYDHHGMHEGVVYNGADDNASGVAAMLAVAKTLASMQKNHYLPKRTIIFIAYDAKEYSMAGSAFYVKHPLVSLKQTMACINLDMLGRIDAPPASDTNYVLVVGAHKNKSKLKEVVDYQNVNKQLNLDIDYTFYGSEVFSQIFYEISDQYNFGKKKIPVLYFTSGMHDDLWKPTDDPDRLSYPILQKRTQLVYYVLWDIAN